MGCCGFGLYASRRGKFVVWADLLRNLKLRGDEHVLDLGCGRGAVLLLAAEQLSTGKAVGVDLWSPSKLGMRKTVKVARRPQRTFFLASIPGLWQVSQWSLRATSFRSTLVVILAVACLAAGLAGGVFWARQAMLQS